jgi:hypothetical protein
MSFDMVATPFQPADSLTRSLDSQFTNRKDRK